MSQLAGAMQLVDVILAGGPGSGCHGDNCGRPAGPGHDEPAAELPSKAPNVPGLMKQYGWQKGSTQTVLRGRPANIYAHPKYGTLIVSNNWYEHIVNGVKVAEKVDLEKGVPFAVKLRTYLKDQVQKSKQTPGLQPKGPQPPMPQPKTPMPQLLPTDSGVHKGIEQTLVASPITKNTPRKKEGVSSGLKNLTFADGSKAIFKPHNGEAPNMRPGRVSNGYQTQREVGAWEIAKLGGVSDLVAPAVERQVEGATGAVLAFQKGVSGFEANNRFDGEKDCMRAGLFDYVIGNTDRHDGNWMIDEKEGLKKDPTAKLKLIDHGLCFPDLQNSRDDISSELLNHTRYNNKDIPADLVAPYLANADKIREALVGVGLPAKSVIHTMDRINALKTRKTWNDLTYEPKSSWS